MRGVRASFRRLRIMRVLRARCAHFRLSRHDKTRSITDNMLDTGQFTRGSTRFAARCRRVMPQRLRDLCTFYRRTRAPLYVSTHTARAARRWTVHDTPASRPYASHAGYCLFHPPLAFHIWVP